MLKNRIFIKSLGSISELSIEFEFPESNIIVLTGKNGVGKTTIVKAFHLIEDPGIFSKSSGLNSVHADSNVKFELDGIGHFSYSYNKQFDVLDSRNKLPKKGEVIAELPVPYGERFKKFSLIAKHDAEIRSAIAANDYESADDLISFLSTIYSTDKFSGLKCVSIGKKRFYFILKDEDYYIREDHFSSGEYFLIQIYRLITSNAKILLIDELDVALDASAQVKIYKAIKNILRKHETKLILISHSLAFMNMVDESGLYYLEMDDGCPSLVQRSFGYIKSDLYGFLGKDRYILTEDAILEGFIRFLVSKYLNPFFEFEIVCAGGEPQVISIAKKNYEHGLFGSSESVIVVVDGDIYHSVENKLSGISNVNRSPVNDIELFIWQNRDRLLSDRDYAMCLPKTQAKKEKDTAKTFWKKLIGSGKFMSNELYSIVDSDNGDVTQELVGSLREHLCQTK